MSLSYNHATLMGYLTDSPTRRETRGGESVASFKVAVNGIPPKKEGVEPEVLFMPCVVFGKKADAAVEYLEKGSPVLVDGRLRQNLWEKDGVKHSRTELVVSKLQFIRKGDDRKGAGSTLPAGGEVPEEIVVEENDIPY